MVYKEENLLQLSGIQHFAFCRRQWALIHIEEQWQEDFKTADGRILHERVHDSFLSESRGNVISVKGMAVHSLELGISGECDVVEFHACKSGGISLFSKEGLYRPYPVEYKRGKPKEHDADELQLCAQAICLEEMLACEIAEGYLYYGEPRRRQRVELTTHLRQRLLDVVREMHELYGKRHTPKVKTTPKCRACSLNEICLPKLCKSVSAKRYVQQKIKAGVENEEDT